MNARSGIYKYTFTKASNNEFDYHHPQGFWKFVEILVLTSWIFHPGIFWNETDDEILGKLIVQVYPKPNRFDCSSIHIATKF